MKAAIAVGSMSDHAARLQIIMSVYDQAAGAKRILGAIAGLAANGSFDQGVVISVCVARRVTISSVMSRQLAVLPVRHGDDVARRNPQLRLRDRVPAEA